MRRFSKHKVSVRDQIRSAWLTLPWPTFGKGEADDPARHQAFFRSYGTKVTRVSPEPIVTSPDRSRPSIRVRTVGQFAVPWFRGIGTGAFGRLLGQETINGLMIAPVNADRRRLLLRLYGPPNTILYLSDIPMITAASYQIEFGEPFDTDYVTHSGVYAAASRSGVTVMVAEEEFYGPP